MSDLKPGGVSAMQEAPYKLSRDAEYETQKRTQPWWTKTWTLVFVTIGCVAADAIVLYSILDKAMTAGAYIHVVVSVFLALLFSIFPLAISWSIHMDRYRLNSYAKYLAYGLLAVFAFLFVCTTALRFAYADTYTDSGQQTASLENTVAATADGTQDGEDKPAPSKCITLTLLLASVPLLSAAITFGSSYYGQDPVRIRIHRLRIRRCELKECLSDLEAAEQGIEEDVAALHDLDQEQYRKSCEMVNTRCNVLRARARFLLAMYLKDPSSITTLSQEGIALPSGQTEVDAIC